MLKCLILNNYKPINIVKDTTNGTVEQVLGHDGKVYIRKTLPGVFLPCKELMSINNPYIVKTVQAACDDAGSYVIEEYAEGKSLADYLDDRKNFSEKEVIGIALQLCEALMCLQKHKLVHRDIKPGNILLHSSGAVKIIDFGACRSFSDNEEKVRDTVVIGTTSYAAPEQFGGKPTDHRADIYSLGVTLKELLGDNYQGELNGIIAKCLEFDPKTRPKDADELKKQLLAANNDHGKMLRYAVMPVVVLVLMAGGFWYYRQQAMPLAENNSIVTNTEKQEDSSEKAAAKIAEKQQVAAEKPVAKPVEQIPKPVKKFEQPIVVNEDKNRKKASEAATETSAFAVKNEKMMEEIERPVVANKMTKTVPKKDKAKSGVKIYIEPKNWFYTYAVTDHYGKRLTDSKELRVADYAHQPEIVLSTGKKELMNMRATYEFHDIKFWGDDLTIGPNAVGNIYRWQVFKDANGNSSKVVHRISGGIIDEIAPYFSLSLSNVGLWFLTGNNPSLTVTVEADNAEPVTMTIPIIIK